MAVGSQSELVREIDRLRAELARRDRRRDSMSPAVLVVDDDPFIRKVIATTLEDVGEFDLRESGADLFLTPFSPLDLLRMVDGLGQQSA